MDAFYPCVLPWPKVSTYLRNLIKWVVMETVSQKEIRPIMPKDRRSEEAESQGSLSQRFTDSEDVIPDMRESTARAPSFVGKSVGVSKVATAPTDGSFAEGDEGEDEEDE